MPEKKLFAFRSKDPKIISFLESKSEVNNYLKSLVERDMKGQLISDTQRLKDLNLTLDIWKKLKDLGVIVPKINDPFAIIQGKEEMPIPPLEILNNGKIETHIQNSDQSFLDDALFCQKCRHQHMKYNLNCSYWNCNCEVRK